MDEIGVMNLIEELSVLIEDSKPVFGKNTMRQVDAQAAFEILDEIRDTFPSEFAQARQIIRERQALLDEAEAQASRLIEDARSQAITIASEQEIVRISQQQADTIMAEARELERETRAGAEDFADEEDSYEIITDPDDFSAVREALEKDGIAMAEADVTMIPQTYVELTDPQALKDLNRTLDLLDDDDDVQYVYTNLDE